MKLQAQKTSEITNLMGGFSFNFQSIEVQKYGNIFKTTIHKSTCIIISVGEIALARTSKDPIHWISKESDRLEWSQTYSIHNPNIQQENTNSFLQSM